MIFIKDRVGEVNISCQGCKIKIIEYNNSKDILVQFLDNHSYTVRTKYSDFKSGEIRNPYHKSLYNIGYLGSGRHEAYKDGKPTKIYDVWQSMIKRCYDAKYHKKFPTYIGCTICKEWMNFQIFGDWFENNYYEILDEQMHLDKDILFKDNKIYSPRTCVFVPQSINQLILRSKKTRGDHPIGVTFCKRSGKYVSRCSVKNNEGKHYNKHLGYFENEHEAFLCYKNFKESYIAKVANEYSRYIPSKIYKALLKYKININD